MEASGSSDGIGNVPDGAIQAQTHKFTTESGEVIELELPDNIHAGDIISGTVVSSPTPPKKPETPINTHEEVKPRDSKGKPAGINAKPIIHTKEENVSTPFFADVTKKSDDKKKEDEKDDTPDFGEEKPKEPECEQKVEVRDVTDPEITKPDPVTIECPADLNDKGPDNKKGDKKPDDKKEDKKDKKEKKKEDKKDKKDKKKDVEIVDDSKKGEPSEEGAVSYVESQNPYDRLG